MTDQWPGWGLSSAAKERGDETWAADLPPMDLGALVNVLVRSSEHREGGLGPIEQNVFADSLIELGLLAEEIRFAVGVAVMLLTDFAESCPDEVASLLEPPAYPHDVAMPAVARALLSPYTGQALPPSALTDRLHQRMGPDRYLSRSFAGQLLDGALVKSVTCADLLATLVHLAARVPLPRRDARGHLRLPALSAGFIAQVGPAFQGQGAWSGLEEAAKSDLLTWARGIRNGQVHQRRWPSILHGERKVAYAWDDPGGQYRSVDYTGLTAQQHVALLLALWNDVLAPAAEAASLLVGATEQGPDGPL